MADRTDHEILLKLSDTQDEVLSEVRTFRKVLFGNGDTGLVERIGNAEQDVKTIKFSMKTLLIPIIGGIIAFIGALLTGIIQVVR